MEVNKKSILYALISVILWSTVASAFKIALMYMTFLDLLMISSFTATIILFLILLFQKKTKIFKLKNFKKSIFMGFINPFIYYIVLFKSYSLLPAQIAQPINYTWPIALVILSWIFLKEKLSFLRFIAILMSFSGVVVISTKGKFTSLQFNKLGILLAFSSAFIWAIYWIKNKKDIREDVLKLFFNFLCGFLFILVFYLIKHGKVEIFHLNTKGILAGIYVGLFEMGITFLFWGKALKYAKSTARVSNLIYLSPFLSLFFISIIVGEKILISTIIGLFLIVLGIVMQEMVRE